MKKVFILLLFTLYNMAGAQLAAFTVSATNINDETCPNNGAISWTTSGTTSNSTLTYSVINTTSNSVVVRTSSLSYTGLPAGSYKIVATQTQGVYSNQAASNVIKIADQKLILDYNTLVRSNEICGNDGEFIVTVTSGRSPYSYQLLDASNNVIVTQTSNVFSGLKAGDYNVRVIDACGSGVTKLLTIKNTQTNIIGFSAPLGNLSATCERVDFKYGLELQTTTSNDIKLPLTVEVSYTNPTTNTPTTETFTYTKQPSTSISGTTVKKSFAPFSMPYFSNISTLPASIKITDGCGKVYSYNYNFNYTYAPYLISRSTSCGSYLGVTFNNPSLLPYQYKLTYISGPLPADTDFTKYDPTYGTFQNNHSFGYENKPIPLGNYTFDIEDSCGRIARTTATVAASEPRGLLTYNLPSCTAGTGGVRVYFYDGEFGSAVLTGAPAAYTANSIPYDFTSDITSVFPDTDNRKNNFYFKNLPPGTYTYKYTTLCGGTEYTSSFTISPYRDNTSITNLNASCNNLVFDYKFDFSNASSSGAQRIALQQYYPATNDWSTLNDYTAPTASNPYPRSADITNYMGIGSGTQNLLNLQPALYRIILVTSAEYNYTVTESCMRVLQTVDLSKPLVFNNAYSFQCANRTYDVIVDANKGAVQLNYSIVSDGTASATVIKDNGTDPIFHSLTGGVYFFRVADACGNFITRKLDIAQLGKPGIKFNPDCATNSLKLSVEGLEFLSYEWYKASDPATILSTTNLLDLGTYDASKAGTYNVRIFTTNPTYCINNIEEIVVSPNPFTAGLAGTGQTITINYDPSMSQLNLFDYLTPPYDGYGKWSEVSGPSSNLLVDQYWYVGLASRGTYNFLYTVPSPCTGAVSTANVIINLLKTCYNPVTNINPGIPVNHGITLLKRAGTDNKLGGSAWPLNRSSAHTVLESNTKGFVITRVPTSGLSAITTPVEGMMVYDTTAKCLKIYVVDNNNSANSGWKCFSTPSCP